MIVTVNLVFRGCQQAEVMVFILTASLWYVVHSVWVVIFMRCCFMDWCNKKFDRVDNGDEADPVTFCGDCRCCLSPTEIQAVAEPVQPASLSQYDGVQQFKTTDGTAELPIRVSESGQCEYLLVVDAIENTSPLTAPKWMHKLLTKVVSHLTVHTRLPQFRPCSPAGCNHLRALRRNHSARQRASTRSAH